VIYFLPELPSGRPCSDEQVTAGLNALPSTACWDRDRFTDLAFQIASASEDEIEAIIRKAAR
jgi:hypothetical protein